MPVTVSVDIKDVRNNDDAFNCVKYALYYNKRDIIACLFQPAHLPTIQSANIGYQQTTRNNTIRDHCSCM